MKKILVSVAAATIALSTTASALEDIKVNGQAKLWYETDNKGNSSADNHLFDKNSATGEVVFKLGMTGKHGDVGFGATLYQGTDMGLANDVVGDLRTNAGNENPFFGELYFTAPVAPDTVLKFGKQELDTPLAFTERWNAMPNTFDAAVAINSSVENLTLIGAYIGKGNAQSDFYLNPNSHKASDKFTSFYGTAFALAGLYKQDDFSANLWLYRINNAVADIAPALSGLRAHGGVDVHAAWFDAGMKAGDVNAKVYLAYLNHKDNDTDTFAAALSADMKVSDVKLFGAASYVNEGDLPVGNTATGSKKTMLPTQGIYTDGKYVAQPGSIAAKVSAATKLGDTALSLNVVHNMNTGSKGETMGGFNAETLETTEAYVTVSQKVGAFDLMGIVMHRHMNDSDTDKDVGGQYVRLVASVNF